MIGKKSNACAGRAVADRGAHHVSRAGCRIHQRQQHLDRGRLPGAVWADEPENLAGTHAQRQIGHRESGAELLAQRVSLDPAGRARHQ
jgi:hypothetical protein